MKLLVAGVVLLASAVSGSTPPARQSTALDRACHATVAAVQQAVTGAAKTQPRTISSRLQVVLPGTVTGELVFNPSGSGVNVGAPPTRGSSFGCGEATASHGPAGRSHVVATLREHLSRSGPHTLTFRLNAAGRRILARLGFKQRAYRRRHPQGSHPPTIAFGIALSYAPALPRVPPPAANDSGARHRHASGALAALQLPPQQKLLARGCRLAAARLNKVVNEAATKQVLTIQTSVTLLRPGKLSADIAFNPSGSTLGVAADGSAASTIASSCGFVFAGGGTGSSNGGAEIGVGLPTRHVVSELRRTIKTPGRYTLTFTLNQKGQRILARLGAAQRAYRTRHPHGHAPPSITWGVGIHYLTSG